MEYTLMLGIVIVILIAITPLVRRVTQGFVKTVSDQLGDQRGSGQPGGDYGYLESSYTFSTQDSYTGRQERLGDVTYSTMSEWSRTQEHEISNQGLTKRY